MGLTLSDSDYTMFDGAQTIAYNQVGGSAQQLSVPNAVGMGPERREIQTDSGFIYVVEQVWYLPIANMNGIAPAEGDYLTDSTGVNWWLQSDIETTSPAIAGEGGVYRVVTRQKRGSP